MSEDYRTADDADWSKGVASAEFDNHHHLLGRVVSLTAQLETTAATLAVQQYHDAQQLERRALAWLRTWWKGGGR